MGARLSYEYVKNYIEGKEGNGCKLLSPEYVDSKTELKIQCACGEVFEKTFNHFKIGKKMCEKCTIKQRVDSRRTPYEKIKNFVNGEQGNGCELLTTLEEYNKYARLRNKCAQEEEIKASFGLPYERDLYLPEKTEEQIIMEIYKKYERFINEEETNGIYVTTIMLFL